MKLARRQAVLADLAIVPNCNFGYPNAMSKGAKMQQGFRNEGFWGPALVAGALLLVLGFLPRSERAIFSSDGGQSGAKAFVAVVPPLSSRQSEIEGARLVRNPPLNRFAAGHRGPAGTQAGASGGVPLGTALFADATPPASPFVSSDGGGTVPAPGGNSAPQLGAPPSINFPSPLGGAPALGSTTGSTSGGATTSGGSTTSGGLTTSGGTTTSGGLTTSGGTTSTSGGTTTLGGTSTSGGTTTSSGGTTTGGSTPPVSSVPEPGTWLMMLFGFFAVGATLRRRPTGPALEN